jgi:hypothetical protein
MDFAQKDLIALVKDSIRKRGAIDNEFDVKNVSFFVDCQTITLSNRTSNRSFRQGIYLNSTYNEVITLLKANKPTKKKDDTSAKKVEESKKETDNENSS